MHISSLQKLHFTSELRELEIAADAPSVVVTLASGGSIIYDEVLYTYDDKVTIFEFDLILEDHIRSKNETLVEFVITVKAAGSGYIVASKSFRAVYCSRMPYTPGSCLEWCRENFLTPSVYRIVPEGLPLQASFIADPDFTTANCNVRISGRRISTDEEYRFSYDMLLHVTPLALELARIHTRDINDFLEFRCGFSIDDFELHEASMSVGQRLISFFIMPPEDNATLFAFRNSFNLIDFALLQADTEAITEPKAETAYINRRVEQYDYTIEKTYRIQLGNLTADDIEFLEDLITSRQIEKLARPSRFGSRPFIESTAPSSRVILTQANIKDVTSSSMGEVDLTYRYADEGLIGESMFVEAYRIFSTEYDLSFT